MRLKVKICGLTNFEDAALALRLGADEIGFVFAPSPRLVLPDQAAAIAARLRAEGRLEGRSVVGVFVNERPEAMARIAALVGLDAVQVHGDESPEDCAAFGFPWYRALRIGTEEEARTRCALPWGCPRLLVDAAVRGAYGGTGLRLLPAAARAAAETTRRAGREFFLAGGLGPDNAAELVAALAPDGIDLSSGVEERPGKKSPAKLELLFAELERAADGVGGVAPGLPAGSAHGAAEVGRRSAAREERA
ncbi:MAG: phosphoribosylanthranilate isomerase [Treponema sp.]|nr:phosphoribosylanthranilate isomerase [Treponema sp.]